MGGGAADRLIENTILFSASRRRFWNDYPRNGCKQISAAVLMNATLSDTFEKKSKLFWRYSVPFSDRLHIKHLCRIIAWISKKE